MFARLADRIRRHPLAAYFILAYLVSWIGVSPLVASGLGWLPPISRTVHVFGALGPLVAAFVVTGVTGGRSGLGELGRRMIRWRVALTWWLLAVLSPVALALVAAGLLAAAGKPWPDLGPLGAAWRDSTWATHLAIASLAYGIGEETGWRGFALPRLQHGRTALRATVILAIFWGLWHLPFFTYLYRLRGLAELIGFYVCFFAGALWLTFLYNSSGGSVLMTILWHISWNVVNIAGAAVSPDLVAVVNGLIIAVGVAVLVIGRPSRLSAAAKHVIEPRPAVPPNMGAVA